MTWSSRSPHPMPSDVIAQLPAQARERMRRAPEELCDRIEERLREFGSEPSDAPPEETLALLASAGAGQEPEVTTDGESDADPTAVPLEITTGRNPRKSKRAIIVWIVAGLVAVAAATFWALR